MIKGVGTDIVLIHRIESSVNRFGDRFTKRILSSTELANAKKLTTAYIAKRFAAKEAVSKALGTGMRAGVSFRTISILNDLAGKPTVTLTEGSLKKANELGINHWHISLSDEKDHAIAFVVAES